MTGADILDAALTSWIGPERRKRLDAVAGGAATPELIEKLRAADKKDWYRLCGEHAKERAEDICWYYKPGDLYYRDGSYLWVYYWKEIDDALKAVGAGRDRRFKARALAETAFVERAERIRTLRIGPPEERKAVEEAGFVGVEFSETLGEAFKRMEADGAKQT